MKDWARRENPAFAGGREKVETRDPEQTSLSKLGSSLRNTSSRSTRRRRGIAAFRAS